MADDAPEDPWLARLRMAAEREMRRHLPASEGGRPAKRHKGSAGGEGDDGGAASAAGGLFDYGASAELATGVTGFLLTCPLQR